MKNDDFCDDCRKKLETPLPTYDGKIVCASCAVDRGMSGDLGTWPKLWEAVPSPFRL